ncbi:hypothetical protein ACLOJK_010327 [Asimina triloba]
MFPDNSNIPEDAANDFEAPLQELFNEVRSMILKGNKDGAICLLKANYLAVKEQIDAGYRSILSFARVSYPDHCRFSLANSELTPKNHSNNDGMHTSLDILFFTTPYLHFLHLKHPTLDVVLETLHMNF